MEVNIIQNESNVLQKYVFRNTGETEAEFKAATKTWLVANTSMTWESFFDRVSRMEHGRIELDMT